MINQTIVDHFKNLGYLEVTVNNWRGKRLYVNLTDDTSFSYDLTQNYKITSDALLDKDIYREALKVTHIIKQIQ